MDCRRLAYLSLKKLIYISLKQNFYQPFGRFACKIGGTIRANCTQILSDHLTESFLNGLSTETTSPLQFLCLLLIKKNSRDEGLFIRALYFCCISETRAVGFLRITRKVLSTYTAIYEIIRLCLHQVVFHRCRLNSTDRYLELLHHTKTLSITL